MKKYIVKDSNDKIYIVKANDCKQALLKVKRRSCKDSDKLKQMTYKLGHLANYFDRANSASSRNILSKDDDKKKAEFFSLGSEVLKQLETEASKAKPGVDFFETGKNETLNLIKDIVSRMYHMNETKFRGLGSKIDKSLEKYKSAVVKKF